MADESLLKKLSAETRTRLRATRILTSLPTIVSELLQNAIDAGASQIDVGVDCAEWSCWVMDDGSGIAKDGLHKIGQDSERGWYNSSKAYTPASLETVSTFGFRGEALASMGDLSCMEISSRTARSRESWTVIVKGGTSLYTGPSIRWRRESPGTVVSIRDAFFSVPVRRQCHPTANKTSEVIRQELETYALVFPDVSFSFQDASRAHDLRRLHVLKIPKTRSPLAAFRHIYGRAFTEGTWTPQCAEEISTSSGQFQIEGFISLVGAHTKSYQFLYINRHPISFCDLHRAIDGRFAASTFGKHAYDDGGETSSRPSARRSSRKREKKPVYVLNLFVPVKHLDNCLEPSKSAVELDNKNLVASFLSATIHSFLVRHNFSPDQRRGGDVGRRKKRRLGFEAPSHPEGTSRTPARSVTPEHPTPDWLLEALQANDAFPLKEPKIPSPPPTHHTWSVSPESRMHLTKHDLRKAQIISQVDRKFIACVVALDQDDPPRAEKANDVPPTALVLIDQHAADERVRVERFMKSICRGFLSHQEGSGTVETKQLCPPVPVLLTRHEASRLAEPPGFHKAFESWGFRFSALEETRSSLEHQTEPDGGYVQVLVSAIPEIVSEKLLLGKEMQELIKGYIGALESRELEPREPSSYHHPESSDEETHWLKALRWCPRELLDLINSKACRGAIMFNDPLNTEQCERLVKQLSATVFPFQCAHGRPTLVPLTRLAWRSGGSREMGLEWENVAAL